MLRSELSFYLNVNIWLVKSFIWGFHAISQKNPNKLFGQSNSLLGKIPEIVKDREVCNAAVHGVLKNQTRLGHWTTAVVYMLLGPYLGNSFHRKTSSYQKQGKKMRGANFKGFLLSPPVPFSSQDTEASFSSCLVTTIHTPEQGYTIYDLKAKACLCIKMYWNTTVFFNLHIVPASLILL